MKLRMMLLNIMMLLDLMKKAKKHISEKEDD
jgi:hypothetical protein